jgi:hypothetical protein
MRLWKNSPLMTTCMFVVTIKQAVRSSLKMRLAIRKATHSIMVRDTISCDGSNAPSNPYEES